MKRLPSAFKISTTISSPGSMLRKYGELDFLTIFVSNAIKAQGEIHFIFWTTFNYDLLGQLIAYRDHKGVITSYSYDMMGRKIKISSPDYGEILYFFDETTGNLKYMQNAELQARHQSIEYVYDRGRLYKIIFPSINGQDNVANVYYKYGQPNSGNQTGRLIYQRDATGDQYFEYGKLGELTRIERKIVLPNGQVSSFKTLFSYDSWNRIQSITYPDGEVVKYFYDQGGNLKKIKGQTTYVRNINYDKWGNIIQMDFGNDIQTVYSYDPYLQRLQNTKTYNLQTGEVFLNLNYAYDYAGNITRMENAINGTQTEITGSFTMEYFYDDMNRLIAAQGNFRNSDNDASYRSQFKYNGVYEIIYKAQEHRRNGSLISDNTYEAEYFYIDGSHLIKSIEYAGVGSKEFYYDRNGNITSIEGAFAIENKHMWWDEVNRLRLVNNENGFHYYLYDADGERVIKAQSKEMEVYENGQPVSRQVEITDFKLYPSAYLTVNGERNYTKHYFSGNRRIAARLIPGNPFMSYRKNTGADDKYRKIRNLQLQDMQRYLKNIKVTFAPPAKPVAVDTPGVRTAARPRAQVYWFHPDHLGTGTLITDLEGRPEQFFLNLPYGETFIEQGGYRYDNPYKFNGKELDEETGLYYYGARYYDPKVSMWLSVDRYAHKYPGISPYNYTAGNPINLVDIKGDSIWITQQKIDGKIVKTIHISGKLINMSYNDVDLDKALSDIKSYMERVYQAEDIDGYAIQMSFEFSIAKTMDEVEDSDHLIILAEPSKNNNGISGAANILGGKVAVVDADYFTGFYDKYIGHEGERTTAHEMGHLLGLSHVENPFNLMSQGRSELRGSSLNKSQFKRIINNIKYGYLNRGKPKLQSGYPNLSQAQFRYFNFSYK